MPTSSGPSFRSILLSNAPAGMLGSLGRVCAASSTRMIQYAEPKSWVSLHTSAVTVGSFLCYKPIRLVLCNRLPHYLSSSRCFVHLVDVSVSEGCADGCGQSKGIGRGGDEICASTVPRISCIDDSKETKSDTSGQRVPKAPSTIGDQGPSGTVREREYRKLSRAAKHAGGSGTEGWFERSAGFVF